jgi:23S rRNA (guanosine2251-2'-O)-methyltransferase
MKDDILYGIHPVEEALKAGRRKLHEVFLATDRASKRLQAIQYSAAAKNIVVQRTTFARLNRLTEGAQHQGVAARVGPFPATPLSRLLEQNRTAKGSRLVVLLDGILDPHNLGAIVRTALGVGAEAVVIPKNRAAGPTPAVSKASAGALEHVRLVEVTNMTEAIKTLKSSGWWVYGMVQAEEGSVFGLDLTALVALVIGGEESGIRPLVKQHCDFLLTIPQQGPVTSLNASVAAAVAMYEVYRQRLAIDGAPSATG